MDRPARRRTPGEGTDNLADRRSGPASVLILFSDTGGGHRAAARALDGALRSILPGVEITWCDPLIGQGRAIARRISSLYPAIIQRSRPTWGAIFHASNTAPSFAAVRAALRTQLRAPLEERLRIADPDVVLSVHPLLNHVTAGAIRHAGRSRALMTVVTDLIAVHRGWTCRGADLVVVATEQAFTAARRRLSPDQVQLLGLPVDLRFRPPRPGERAAERRRLCLDLDRPTVLISGGGEGSGSLFDQVLALSVSPRPWQVIAVCGRNERLRSRLLRVNLATPTLVLGFVDDMPELLRASDLAVGKAGPGMIVEALVTGVPLVLTSYLPGQEGGNVRFVVDEGVGRYAPSPQRLVAAVKELLGADGARYRAMAARAAEMARPHAALDIASACVELAARYRANSQASR